MPRKSKYSVDEISAFLREVAAGATVRSVCRRNAFTEKTFYRWRARYGQLIAPVRADQSDVALQGNERIPARNAGVREEELRRLQEENRRLKELVADLSLENRDLRVGSVRPPPVRLLASPHDRR